MGQKEKQDKLLKQRYYSERKNKKLFHLLGHSKEKGKKKRKKQARRPYWLPVHSGAGAEGGDNGSQHTGNFKRHCLETRNEKASVRHDYLRTGLARWASLLPTPPQGIWKTIKPNFIKLHYMASLIRCFKATIFTIKWQSPSMGP